MNELFVCVFHAILRMAWGQGSHLITIRTLIAIPVCHTAGKSTQWTEGSSIAFVKLNDLEIADKVMVKYVSYVHSLLKENWTVCSVSGAGSRVFCFPYLTGSSQHAAKSKGVQLWMKRHARFFILIPFQNSVSNKRIWDLLMLWNPCVWGTESLTRMGGSRRPWAPLSSCPRNPGLCWMCLPHVQRLFPTMQFGFWAPWIS